MKASLRTAKNVLRWCHPLHCTPFSSLVTLTLLIVVATTVYCTSYRGLISDTGPAAIVDSLSEKAVFNELCNSEKNSEQSLDEVEALLSKIDEALRRYDNVPSNGGAAGQRWSAATNLPLRQEASEPVKVRFVSTSSHISFNTQAAAISSILSGIPLNFLGVGWKGYSATRRFALAMTYADVASLKDSDVMVVMDSDAIFTGADAYPFFESFVASTAESEAEHMEYSTSDIRLGKRLPPVLFNGENYCMHRQVVLDFMCFSYYHVVETLMEEWAHNSSVPYYSSMKYNPIRYLNSGFFVARVWAFRLLVSAGMKFMEDHNPNNAKGKNSWVCDQSVMGTLYIHQRWWEFKSGALDGVQRQLSDEEIRSCPFETCPRPNVGGRGPYNLPPGLLGIDELGRSGTVVGWVSVPSGVFYLSGIVVSLGTTTPIFDNMVLQYWEENASPTTVGIQRSPFTLEVVPRPYIDCIPGKEPPACAYRSSVWGLDEGQVAIRPFVYHHAGGAKTTMYKDTAATLSWLAPLMYKRARLSDAAQILRNAPPIPVWKVDPATNEDWWPKLRPHDPNDDLSFDLICKKVGAQK